MKYLFIGLAVVGITAFALDRNDINPFRFQAKEKSLLAPAIDIHQKWELPSILIEVSGIAYMDDKRFACVQDEAGTIFIYNIGTNGIEKEIVFTGPGDFEGITLNGNTAYIVRSDGMIFEVNMSTKQTAEYRSGLTANNNVETLFFDKTHNRLLLAGKEPDEDKSFKNIYAFNLTSHQLEKDPIFRIDLGDAAFDNNGKAKKKKKNLAPSGIAVNPVDKNVYILDGPSSRLVVTSNTGKLQHVYDLGKEFYKPEGISFSPAGELFISNEGKKIPANIIRLQLAK